MVLVTPEELAQTQANTANIRNICVLAHVDHGTNDERILTIFFRQNYII